VLRSRLAAADAPRALRLLDWARGSRLAVDPALLERLARDRIAPWLLDTDLRGQEALGRELVAALEHYAELRAPIVEALAVAAAEDTGGVDRAFAGPVRRVLTPDRLRAYPGLDVAYEVGGVAGQPELRFEALVGILRHRGRPLPDSVLLTRLWPEGRWSLAQADHAARYLPLERVAGADEGLVGWLDRPLAARELPTPVTDAVVNHYLSLAERLRETKLLPPESDSRGAAVRQTLKMAQRLASAKRSGDVLDVLKDHRDTGHPIQRRLLIKRLPARLARMELEASQVDKVLERLGTEFAGLYLDQLSVRLQEASQAQDSHIIAGLVMASGPVAQRHRRHVDAVVASAIGDRGKKGREHVAQILRDHNREFLAADLPMPSGWAKLGLGWPAKAPRNRKGEPDV
jgi:hypothetical protein